MNNQWYWKQALGNGVGQLFQGNSRAVSGILRMICLLILVIWVCLICENYQDTYLTIFALSLYKLYSHDTLEKKPLNAIGLWESLAGWQASQHPSLQTCWWPPFNSVSDRVADSGEVGQDPRRQHRWSLIILFLLEKFFFFQKRL